MRRLLSSMVCLAMIGAAAPIVYAQSAPASNEFDAFKKKNPPSQQQATPNQADALTAALGEADSSMVSPLGPGGQLPLGSMTGAGSYSMGSTDPNELQAMMEQQAADQQRKLEEQTFETALKQLLPLQPEQIRRTLESFKISREAAETPITVPEPRQVVQTVSLDPGDAPQVIKMAPGHVTTFTILDSTGAPWPIQDVSWAGKFEVSTPEEGGHVIRLTPMSAHGVGNVSIRLVDLITPITLRLQTGIDEVHYRFDARIPRPGPLAKTPIIEFGGIQAVAGRDDNMTGFLDGTPPKEAVKLLVKGADGRTAAWKVADQIYLRTPLTLLSPGWDSSVSSADGMNVYTLANAPVILLSDQGRMVRAHIAADEVTP